MNINSQKERQRKCGPLPGMGLGFVGPKEHGIRRVIFNEKIMKNYEFKVRYIKVNII